MAESVGKIYYEVEAETSKLVNGGHQVELSLGGMQKQFDKTDKAASVTQFQMTKTAAAVQELGRQAQAAQNPLGGLSKMLGGLLTLQGVNGLVLMAESYNEMSERVKMATRSQEEYELVQRRLLETANGTYRSMKEAQEVFIGTSDNIRDMGYTLNEALDITGSLSYAFVRNATSADRAQRAMRAYDMALNKGKVDADGWLSIVGAIPTVVNDIAQAMGKSAQEVREMGASGKISADQLNQGLLQSFERNKKAADDMATTVRDAFTRIKNSMEMLVGEANQAHGATALLTSAMNALADNLETVVSVLMVAGAGALAKYIANTTAATLASVRATLAARTQAAAALSLAQAEATAAIAAANHATATAGLIGPAGAATAAINAKNAALERLAVAQGAARAAGVGLLGILGGPAGIVALVASAAAGVYLFGNKASEAAPKVDLLTGSIRELNNESLVTLSQDLTKELLDMKGFDAKAKKASARIETLKKNLSDSPNNANAKEWREELARQNAVIQDQAKLLPELEERLKKVNAEIEERNNPSKRAKRDDPEAAKVLKALEEEAALLKVTGAARKELQALQRLGDNASPEQIARAKELVKQIYDAEQAQKSVNKAVKDGESDKEKQKKAAEDYLSNLTRQSLAVENITAQEKLRQDLAAGTVVLLGDQLIQAQNIAKAIDMRENTAELEKLGEALAQSAMYGEELAKAKARAKLNAFATPEEIALAEQLAVYAERISSAQNVDPMLSAQRKYEEDLVALQTANQMKLVEDQRYLELKAALEHDYEEQKRVMQEETFRKQSEANDLLMNSIDAMASAGTSAITGMLQRTMSLNDTLRSLASSVLNEVVKSLVQVGVTYAKNLIMGKATEAMTTVASVANAATVATAWAPAAAMTSLASFGANAAPATAGITSTTATAKLLSASGGRQYGGPVGAGGMYRINENGAPEILNTASGLQYLLPNSRGEVVSNKDATAGGAAAAPIVNVNIIESKQKAGQVERSQMDGETVINVFIADLLGDGNTARAIEGKYGLATVGR